MWVFSDFGLLMPALVPAKHANDPAVLAWTNNGEYELQVRARLREHLEYFMENYMEEGTYNPTIHATPDKDYNYRIYTTREAYGEGIKQIALNMDYEKFKDSSMKFKWNDKYHSILTNIWAKLCELNTPGGIWGPRSDDNPTGYTSTRGWRNAGWYEGYHNEYYGNGSGRRIGESFGNVQFDDEYGPTTEELDELLENGFHLEEGVDDYIPGWYTRTEDLIIELDRAGSDHEDWMDYVSEAEWVLVQPEVERRVQEAKKAHRRFKKNRRGGKKNFYSKR